MLPVVAVTADRLGELGVALGARARSHFFPDEAALRLGVVDLAGYPQRPDHVIDVGALAKQVEANARTIGRVGGAQLQPATRSWIKSTDAGRETVHRRRGQAWKPQRGVVGDRRADELHVRSFEMRLAAQKDDRGAAVAGEWPGLEQMPARA